MQNLVNQNSNKRKMADDTEPGSKKMALDLSTASTDTIVKFLVDVADESILVTTLKSVEAKLSMSPNNELHSHDFLHAVVYMLEQYKMTGVAQLLSNSRKILQVICQDYHLQRRELVQMGIMGVLSDIMTREAEKQSLHAWTETDESITLLHIISGFLPAIQQSCIYDVTSSASEFLCSGPQRLHTTWMEIANLLKIIVPKLFKICQTPDCSISYKILLIKTICWAPNISSDLVKIEELISYVKNLIDGNPIQEDSVVIGIVTIRAMCIYNLRHLINERMNEYLVVKKPIFLSLTQDVRFKIIFDIFFLMTTYWLSEDTISKFQINEQNLIPRLQITNSTLECIMPDVDEGKPSQMNINISYNNLRKLVKDILNLPDISHHKGKLTASPEGIRRFSDLVTFIVKTIDALIIRIDFLVVISDLCDTEDLPVPKHPTDIILELYSSASFDRVLGSSQSPEELTTDPLVRALRLLSILYEVNENWGILFGSLSTEKLIDRNYFISEILKEVINRTQLKEVNLCNLMPVHLLYYAEEYPFLILMEHRQYLFRWKICKTYLTIDNRPGPNVLFDIPRKNLLDAFAKILNKRVEKPHQIWEFKFIGEVGEGLGVSKEFYTEFSRDCQRFSHGLWSGETGEVIDGVSYVNSQCGLFPPPEFLNNPMEDSYLYSVGVIMAKSIVDEYRLDIKFSNALYKCLFKKNLDAQHLSLIDIKNVMPYISKFIESLVDALREKWIIRMEISLTIKEQNQAISNITCDGCSFEDLCVNFTLPGFPDIEMMEGGSEVFLTIENLENYLKLLIWWILYENPQKSIKNVRNGFESILDTNLMKYFYPHEFEESLCGVTKELWTVDILKQNCFLQGFSVEAPVVQYLFEILSALSACDQRHFLQFVTSAPRLPIGGLSALNPKFTVNCQQVDGNPDKYLPISSTCSNALFIPDYSCKEVLEEKLLLAIREGRNEFGFY